MRNYTDVRVVCVGCFGFLTSTTGSDNPRHSCFDVEKQNFFVVDCPRRDTISGYRPCPHSSDGRGFCCVPNGCPFEHCEDIEEFIMSS